MDPFIEESIRKRQKQSLLKRIIAKWPLQRYLGVYAFLPLFVAFGASLEFLMINWTVNGTNFYKTYKKREIERRLKYL
ncbi:hypothetical protein B4U79_11889 [Dinothrombium tinctorium]|uniref:Small integral membrane protein 4 n=1 Tax=Dinothrombium tinctorium TaxID=1965070 RepID=A0A3S3P3G8_9ACAR|nr:hypothetical protein B4U79_11889 [Dinothrombium tinctorium]